MRFTVIAVLAVCWTMCFTSGAESATCSSVTVAVEIASTVDVQTLTDALACEGEGNFNITWYSSLTIKEIIEVSDTKNVTITGAGVPISGGRLGDDNGAGVIIDAGRNTGLFSVSDGSTLRLNNLVLEGGNAQNGGAVSVLSCSSLLVFGCSFKNNNASNGGAIFASNSTIFVYGSTSFNDNSALSGGGIYARSSEITIDGDAIFSTNSARLDGGVIYQNSSEIAIDGDAMFTNNSAERFGGVISAISSEISVSGDAFFANNFAGVGGCAVYVTFSNVSVHGNTEFASNVAGVYGGVIYASLSDIAIDGALFTNNSAGIGGGAVYASHFSKFAFHGHMEFSSNSALTFGGAMYATLSEIGIDGNTTFRNNSATLFGGAVYVTSSNVSAHGNTEFASNYVALFGGAISTDSSEIGIDGNTTFRDNWSSSGGGAVFAADSEIDIDENAYFTNNTAGRNGGAVFAVDSEIIIGDNAIFTNNAAEEGGAILISRSNIAIDGNAIFTHNSADESGGAVHTTSSEIAIDGSAIFTYNSAGGDGGAIFASSNNLTFTGSKVLRGDLSGSEGGSYFNAGGEYTYNWSVAFVGNSASGVGGAMFSEWADIVDVRYALLKSNEASLGGAVYISAVDDKQTIFSSCIFERNDAEDGGAVYLNTGPGVDIFTATTFRNNFAQTSGGAIFHTGSMRVFNTSFVANQAGVEGAGVISIGVLEALSNVNFSENTYFCRVGEYGYLERKENNFCSSCFDEVCSRCSSDADGIFIREEVRIDGKPVCAEPPLGATAPSNNTTVENLTLDKGYFRTSNKSHDIRQCYQESACHGGDDANKYCTTGYAGPYCAVCAKGFTPGIAYSCRECTRGVTISAVGLSVAVGLAVLLFAALLVLRLRGVVHNRTEDSMETDRSLWKKKCWSCGATLVNILPLTAIKIVVTVWQIVSQFDAIAGDAYPELYRAFVSKLNPVNLDLDFIFAYSCLVTNDFYDHLLFATITPFLAVVVLAGSYFIAKKRNSCSEFAQMREVRHKHQAALLYVAFLVYSPVSYRIFQTFGCDELDDGESYLRADYSLSCLTARHSWYKVYALIMVGVYPIGIAAAFTVLVVWHRRDLVKHDRGTMLHLKPLNGVWAAYKRSRYYYEVVECIRRISFTAIAALVFPNSAAQVSIAFLFAVVFVFMSEVLSPFQKSADTRLYRWGNGVIVASMYVAFLMKVDVGEEKQYAFLTYSGVLILANVFMVVTVLVEMVLLANQMRGMKNSVRVIDRPLRRTHPVSCRDVPSPNEGGLSAEGDISLECKDSDA